MITWSVTTYNPGADRPHTHYGAADSRQGATTEAAEQAIAAIDAIAPTTTMPPFLSITIDDELLAMIAIGHDDIGRPDTLGGLARIHAALTPAPAVSPTAE